MSNKLKVLIKKAPGAEDLPLPQYMTDQSAGMDLYANVESEEVLKKGKIKLIPTGIHIQLPKGYEAQIRPRSGLALKHGITLLNTPGTIDADYRGEIKVIMINLGEEDFIIQRGDRIAQMIINKIEEIEWIPVKELDHTERKDGGFGHTGV
ncbi:MAG: dUTP pyrophosphatase [Epulopiscium sp.]|jgi:dUTP pyrophosphatase|uniref:Deoxyuridine 5'-triphosphate nucleotidohydrolase n=1 Tax=Defluviitalea raffinosedens TaxID=1450156 RepID=A0A7C8HJZ7_9FIRM|nr:dUTP diphosphatase [Defluviitalea raffinosedens]MBZ4668567.1 dut [Defluviitaleaceae bacterium]MDK2787201.1 dUTP pyrophosphatase [Candidatus Epulonipiscium sp.]KAE9637088.1 dUTP diphosphatase [Defluviitalea raffinosedens]MBM7685153.1 dUTP pyrophosphatase [Defluviitalea raffinosedens]HHW67407.1 dUTP diphosphatase [Candidatus Epulonipiscium sp.]